MNNDLIRRVLALHFDENEGSPYWLKRKKDLGFDPVRDIRGLADFHRFGPMDIDELRRRSLLDFVPRRLRHRLPEMILAETGGTTGPPCRRLFLPEEFEQAFLIPWERAAHKRGFPFGATWLFIGPSGPHIIGQAARAMARRLGSLEPFSVDCDPRWIKKQDQGSLGAVLYLDHIVDQALDIIDREAIGVLFTTPPLLLELGKRMTTDQRRAVRGIHLGGLGMDTAARSEAQAMFANAVLLPGYGNSLLGVAFEEEAPLPGRDAVYTVADPALHLQLIADDPARPPDLTTTLPPGERGRVVAHRLDESFLLINLVERDGAMYCDPGRRRITGVGAARQAEQARGVY